MTTETRKPSSIQTDEQYTSEDADKFSNLVIRCDQQSSVVAIKSGDEEHNESDRSFDYTSSDDAMFDNLMQVDVNRQRIEGEDSKNTQHYAKAKNINGYTSKDHESFTNLMSFTKNDADDTGSHEPPLTDNKDFIYSEQDHLKFEQLALLSGQEDSDTGSSISREDHLAGATDRDVGVIKIVEYDKLKADRSNRKDRANENIKIRFFD